MKIKVSHFPFLFEGEEGGNLRVWFQTGHEPYKGLSLSLLIFLSV
jgi:hypothetical protein